MKAFVFADYKKEIDIAGNVFVIDTSSDNGDRIRKCTLQEKELAAEVSEEKKTGEDLLAKFQADINSILGDGAFEKIFAARTPTVADASDVMLYIVSFVVECSNERKKNRQIDIVK